MMIKRLHSDATKEKIRATARATGQSRTAAIQDSVRSTMLAIDAEVTDSGGVYPHNNNRLSSAEVARRAGIHPTTLFNKKNHALGEEVSEWLSKYKKPVTSSTESTGRRPLATRIAEWKRLYENLAQAYRESELELQQIQAENADLKNALAKLEGKITPPSDSSKRNSPAKVVSISKAKKSTPRS